MSKRKGRVCVPASLFVTVDLEAISISREDDEARANRVVLPASCRVVLSYSWIIGSLRGPPALGAGSRNPGDLHRTVPLQAAIPRALLCEGAAPGASCLRQKRRSLHDEHRLESALPHTLRPQRARRQKSDREPRLRQRYSSQSMGRGSTRRPSTRPTHVETLMYERKHVREMLGYVPGHQPDGVAIKLNTNENPFPPSARVIGVPCQCPAGIAPAISGRLGHGISSGCRAYPWPCA